MSRRAPTLNAPIALIALIALVPAGCAYYNTFYTAKKSFEQAELQMLANGEPDARAAAGNTGDYDKAIEWSNRVIRDYPKSKYVDDAMLLIGRSMLAKGDYDRAIDKFKEMREKCPASDLTDQAVFYTAVALDRNRERDLAVALYDSVLMQWPNTKLRDDVLYRRAGLLIALKHPERAEADLRELAGRQGPMGYDAGLRLAEALFAGRRFEEARPEFERVAERAPTDRLRLEARLRVGDCDEAGSNYARAADTYARLVKESTLPEGKARARLRYGSALALSGQVDRGLAELKNVVDDQPRTPWAAEATYRTGYIHEVVRDDLESARTAYGRVAEQQPGSPFVAQAKQRGDNLARLAEMTSAAADTSAGSRAAQAAFESAELYLFQLGKFDRAIAEYERAEREDSSSSFAPRAALARGWILQRRMNDAEGARLAYESVIARWPESDAATTARRALANPADSTFAREVLELTSVQFPLVPGNQLYVPPPPSAAPSAPRPANKAPDRPGGAVADSLAHAAVDSLIARPDSLAARADSLHAATDSLRARADTTRVVRPAARDTTAKFKP